MLNLRIFILSINRVKSLHKSLHTLLFESKFDIIKTTTSTWPNFNFPTKFQSS